MSPGGGGKIYWHLLAKNYTDATRVRFNVIDGVVDRPGVIKDFGETKSLGLIKTYLHTTKKRMC